MLNDKFLLLEKWCINYMDNYFSSQLLEIIDADIVTDKILNETGETGGKPGEPQLGWWNNWANSFGQKTEAWGKGISDKPGESYLGGASGEKLQQLGKFMQQNPNATAGTLAAAGLLGTYYLWKKLFGKKKKPDVRTIATAESLDNPEMYNRMSPGMRNSKV